jgi:hypothetical protein
MTATFLEVRSLVDGSLHCCSIAKNQTDFEPLFSFTLAISKDGQLNNSSMPKDHELASSCVVQPTRPFACREASFITCAWNSLQACAVISTST